MSTKSGSKSSAPNKGNCSATQSICTRNERTLSSKAEASNKELLLNPNSNISNRKTPSIKSTRSKSSRASSLKVGQSCRSCYCADNSRMVQCDDCDRWHHFNCVGVDSQIEMVPWQCVECEKGADRNRKFDKQPGTANVANASSVSKQCASSESKRDHQKLGRDAIKSTDSLSVSSRRSSIRTIQRLELQLQKLEAEQTLLDEKKNLIEQQFSVLEELASLNEEEAEEVESKNDSKVQDWLNRKSDACRNCASCEEFVNEEQSENSSDSSSEEEQEQQTVHDLPHFNSNKRSTPRRKHVIERGTFATSTQFNCSLSRNQLAARQIVAKDLPIFTGNPEDWPLFFSTYKSTTRMCGYTNDENMIRLISCLKGEAFTAVRSYLLYPSTVPKAMDAFKLRFVQPQFIIHSVRDKVLAMPTLKADSIDKTIDFALAVQNFVATIDACGRKEYRRDVSLLSDLVGKLPTSMKLEWARYMKGLRKVNLADFSEWLYNIAADACLVSEPRKIQETLCYGTRKKTKPFINTHAEQPSLRNEDLPGPSKITHKTIGEQKKLTMRLCIVCKGNCALLIKCKRFLDLSYDGKWATIHEAKVCRKCLKQHKGGCMSKECGINGCTFKHHPLLHKELSVTSSTANNEQANEAQACNTHQGGSSAILFRYVPVVVYGDGNSVHCYAFLDDGSSLTLMDQDLAEELNLSGEPNPLCLKWTGGTHRSENNSHKVALDISGLKGKRFHFENVRTVSELQLPPQSLDVKQLQSEYRHLRGVPAQSYRDVRPRLLIGVQHAYATLVRKSREGRVDQPIAINTNLGWTIYAGAPNGQSMSMLHYAYHVKQCNHDDVDKINDNMERALKDLFAIESLGVTSSNKEIRSQDDERAIQLLHDLTQFNGKRYETGLLWRNNNVKLPDSKPMALKRMYSMQWRMEKDPDLARILDEKLADYLNKGYIRKLTTAELEENHKRV
ncbi:uncharacterized protein LOC129732983 isoform X1 [Wyeomyia smithii]|uniref:uncharacterized protein LOC129732983 isoform X1 n=1 Tax=Wyeomyia smithii TaxID=174621 RepID=UPI002467E737|nr:uncharacterized protein LOC129732983 isoform X1 [Wyeomyia smithii]